MKNNLETIKSYEIELTTSENLFYKVEKYSKKNLNTNNLVINNQSKDNKKHIEIVLLDDAALIVDAGLNAQKQFAQNVLRGLTEEEKHVCMNVFDKICNNAEELLRGESK